MDWFFSFITENAPHAHWVVFGALILAGFNFPISEDMVLILSGVLASTVVPENTLKLFIAVFCGAYLSDWIVYGLGRLAGPGLLHLGWFRRLVNKRRLNRINDYYRKYGVATLLIGRFIPFGVRNCLFMTAGMAKMPFFKFIVTDGIACLASNSLLFWLAYTFGKHYDVVKSYHGIFEIILFVGFVVALIGTLWYKKAKKANAPDPDESTVVASEGSDLV